MRAIGVKEPAVCSLHQAARRSKTLVGIILAPNLPLDLPPPFHLDIPSTPYPNSTQFGQSRAEFLPTYDTYMYLSHCTEVQNSPTLRHCATAILEQICSSHFCLVSFLSM